MSAPVLRWLFFALETVRKHPPKIPHTTKRTEVCTAVPFTAASSLKRPLGPTLRANPFPEVTDPFCRLPLTTLFHRLEAANLGDLMRLLVRPRVRIRHAAGFSRDVEGAPKRSKSNRLCQVLGPISGQSDSRPNATPC